MMKQFFLVLLLGVVFCVPLQAAQDLYGPIGRQDTLWNIAEELRPSKNVTTQQVMMALYKKNPHAFTVNNISSLRKEAYLLAPSEAEVKQIKRKTAIQMVQRHNTRWKKRRFVRVNAPVPEALKQRLAAGATEVVDGKTADTTTKAPEAQQGQVATATVTKAPQTNASSGQPTSTAAKTVLEKQLDTLRQELAQTKTENKRLNDELLALRQEQKQTATQSKANEAIQVQLDALRHELEELRTILAQKDNHIKVLQASLKDASQAIKSQHADNMRLYNKLKELSPESLAAALQDANKQATQPKPGKPQLELAAVNTKNTKPTTALASKENGDSDAGITKVWADEMPGGANQQNHDQLQANRPSQPANAVKQDGESVTLGQILSNQAAEPALVRPQKSGFILPANRSATVSPIAWAAVLVSFVFILFLIFRALLMQNELRRLESD